jgi:transposase
MLEAGIDAATEFAALVGLDWADQKHDVVLVAADAARCEQRELAHTPEAIDAWACELRQRFGGRPVAVCFEQTHGAIAYALLKYDFLVLFPLPPARLTKYREAFTGSGAKDDPTDAALLLDYLRQHRNRLRAWRPDSPQTRELRLLAEYRRDAVDQRTRLTNQLTAVLKLYFPQALVLVGEEVSTPLASDFLSRWTTLESAQKATPDALRKFYWAHFCRSAQRIQERLDLLESAQPITNDRAIIQSSILRVRCLVSQIRALAKAIGDFELRICQLMQQHPDAALFQEVPGAGDALAPRLLAAFGSDRERFNSAQELQTLSGAAPVTKRSGKRCTVHRRWACPKFLLQTFHEFAGCSVPRSVWAAAFYDQQRAAGKGHHAAIRSLAFKWIRVLFRCWKTRTPYSEARYLDCLRKRNAPLLKFLKPLPTTGA